MLGGRPNLVAVHHIIRSSPRSILVLGPTFFLIYVNDASEALSPGAHLEAYVDDITLCSLVVSLDTSPGPADAALNLQTSVDRLHQWGRRWRISFEPSSPKP